MNLPEIIPTHDARASLPTRADLHCHSEASNKASEVVLNAISCPECYSKPADVYAQATGRGMDFVTITDHDTIDGALCIAGRDNVIVGEELTCWFPEDGCKMHVLVYGIGPEEHERLQELAENIYDVAAYVERERIAHSVAHPIYRQNDKLERWHVERLLLLFKGFECLNGAHSSLHRSAFEPLLEKLTAAQIQRLSETHDLVARWPDPHVKTRTGGSDDHGLLNVGRTWTEFPANTKTPQDVLECLRTGQCRPGGEAGSSAKLAHTFYSVAVRYYVNHILTPDREPNFTTRVLQALVGEKPAPSNLRIARQVVSSKLRKLGRRVAVPFKRQSAEPTAGTAVLKRLFTRSAMKHFGEHPDLRAVLERGLPPLGEHDEMFALVSQVNRDVTHGVADAINRSIDEASFTGLFDSIGAVVAQQFVLLPYYFAVFHQNKERHLLREITRQHQPRTVETLRVGLFTDTLDEVNGVARFIRDMGEQAQRLDRRLVIHTCSDSEVARGAAYRKNFPPLLSRPLPHYEQLRLNLPPLLDVLEWSDRQQFDAIHISTPGPMGLCGWLASKMLRVPLLATYHTDFPAYVASLTRDHRFVAGTIAYMKWLYHQTATVFSRSNQYRFNLRDLGLSDEKLRTIRPGVNTSKFSPDHRDLNLWADLCVREPLRLLYVGRVSVEKNLPLLADAFRQLCRTRNDTALIVAGDGPYSSDMQRKLVGTPSYFLGHQNDQQLGRLYASADLFAFPSRTDTLGQVVMEAQACGLPVVVSTEGGPKEMMDDGITGISAPARDPRIWSSALNSLLDDPPRRQRMARAAPQRAATFSLQRTFEDFWTEHLLAVEPAAVLRGFASAAEDDKVTR
jgi:glycosyltransferase involved in cell wall biosynthesis